VYAEERQQAIAAHVQAHGRASVAELAAAYDVTTETVRRDLAVLDRAGALCRVHGGAVPAGTLSVTEPGLDERDKTRAGQKESIARTAVGMLPRDGSTVLFDAGTTTARIAAKIPADRQLVAVTNSVPIAVRLGALPAITVQLLGGRVRGLTQATVGEQTLRALDTMRVDIAFIGTNGISVRHGLSTPDDDEAAVKRAMVRCADFVVVVADSSKIGREEFISFAPLRSVDVLVTDPDISTQDQTHFSAHGVDVVVTEGQS
jgi:DeoR family fructose operon transcriptional repressor